MAGEKDRIFVAIGVSKPDGDLEALPGAVTAAKRMTAWAEAHDYLTVCLLDDHGADITVELLREKIATAIEQVTDQTELKRLVVFFAGHGAAQAVGDQYWMLSNWYKRPTEAIKVSALQRMLEYYGPRQVAIIGDACQEFSARFIDVTGSPVLDRTDEQPRSYELDQFFAVDVGKQAFMIKATQGTDAFCIFTEVLLDALEGDAPAPSFEQVGSDRVVTSQSLAKHLEDAVAKEAGKHGVRMIPRPQPGFYTDRIYVSVSDVPAGGTVLVAPHDGAELAPPAPASASGRRRRQSPRRIVKKARLKKPSDAAPDLEELDRTVRQERESRQEMFSHHVRQAEVRVSFESHAGVCVSGATVKHVELAFGGVTPVYENPNWFRFHLDNVTSLGWSDALVTLDDGRICSVCAVQNFVAALHLVGDGTSVSLFHRPIGGSDDEGGLAIDMLAALHAGSASPEQIIDMAARLRDGKHRVITMGCIAAQFYDAIRDVDSLRQMASYYAQHQQPVPLDIVLFGGGTIMEQDGRLFARIPEVPAREPRTEIERERRFTSKQMPGFDQHPIAGRLPWMRQAWSAVATVVCDASAEGWRTDALAAMEHLGPGAFTTFVPDGRQDAVRLAGGHLTPASLGVLHDDAAVTT